MNRLKTGILVALAVMLVGSCSDDVVQLLPEPVGNGMQTTATGIAAVSTTLPTTVNAKAAVTPDPGDLAARMPQLPDNELPARLPSEPLQSWLNGSQSYMASLNTLVEGNARSLDSVEGNFSWAIYQFPLSSALAELVSFTFEVSNVDFGGDTPGYWLGIANYAESKWQFLANTQSSQRTFSIEDSSAYISSAGNVYVFAVIAGNQSMHIDRVGIAHNPADWIEVIVDATPTAGWMPSIVFDRLDNPLVAYIDMEFGYALMATGNTVLGLEDPANWELTYIENNPESLGDIDDIGARAKWPDIMLGPIDGLPRVSLIYDEITNKEDVSRAGLSVKTLSGFWLNYRFGFIDEAAWTSVDVIPGSTQYGMVTHARNSHWGDREPYDMTYVTFNIGSPGQEYEQSRNFGENWKFPHLKYVPASGAGAVHMHGGNALLEVSPDQWNYFNKIEPLTATNEFGSLAVNPDNNFFGGSFTRTSSNTHWLTYLEYDEALIGSPETVDTLVRVHGVETLGDTNQLAYKPDGTPAIVYTEFDGNWATVKYAEKTPTGWEIRRISAESSFINDPGDMVVVDLAFDGNGRPAVCFNQLDIADNSSLHVAFRGF